MLKLDKEVLEELKFKHRTAAEVKKHSLLHGRINKITNCYFNDIDEIMVGRAASLTKNSGGQSGGPSHADYDHFRHMLLSKKFKAEAKELFKRTNCFISKNVTPPRFISVWLMICST